MKGESLQTVQVVSLAIKIKIKCCRSPKESKIRVRRKSWMILLVPVLKALSQHPQKDGGWIKPFLSSLPILRLRSLALLPGFWH